MVSPNVNTGARWTLHRRQRIKHERKLLSGKNFFIGR